MENRKEEETKAMAGQPDMDVSPVNEDNEGRPVTAPGVQAADEETPMIRISSKPTLVSRLLGLSIVAKIAIIAALLLLVALASVGAHRLYVKHTWVSFLRKEMMLHNTSPKELDELAEYFEQDRKDLGVSRRKYMWAMRACMPNSQSIINIANLHIAAEKGDPSAQLKLGIKYKIGEELPQNDALSEMWIRKSAMQGNTGALYALGLRYETTDHDEAMKWFWYAAEQGDPVSLFHLGGTYYKGIGVGLNYAKAYFFFLLAMSCSSDYIDFLDMVSDYSQRASSQLNQTARLETESLAALWHPKSWEQVKNMAIPEW